MLTIPQRLAVQSRGLPASQLTHPLRLQAGRQPLPLGPERSPGGALLWVWDLVVKLRFALMTGPPERAVASLSLDGLKERVEARGRKAPAARVRTSEAAFHSDDACGSEPPYFWGESFGWSPGTEGISEGGLGQAVPSADVCRGTLLDVIRVKALQAKVRAMKTKEDSELRLSDEPWAHSVVPQVAIANEASAFELGQAGARRRSFSPQPPPGRRRLASCATQQFQVTCSG